MSAEAGAFFLVVWIPVMVVWAYVMVDLARRRETPPATRITWAVVCTLVWPALIVYLLTRPTSGRIVELEARSDGRAQLVAAVLDHEAGRIDDARMAAITAGLLSRE